MARLVAADRGDDALESKNGKKTEKKVKDKQLHTYYWFDRA